MLSSTRFRRMSPSRVPAVSSPSCSKADVGKDFLTLLRESFSACLTSERSKSSFSVSACFGSNCLLSILTSSAIWPAICPWAVSTALRAPPSLFGFTSCRSKGLPVRASPSSAMLCKRAANDAWARLSLLLSSTGTTSAFCSASAISLRKVRSPLRAASTAILSWLAASITAGLSVSIPISRSSSACLSMLDIC